MAEFDEEVEEEVAGVAASSSMITLEANTLESIKRF